MPKIIALVGFIGSGKDTVAEYLVKNHGFLRDSFATPLKQAVSAIFGWDYSLLEGLTPESRLWRDQIDSWWADRLGIPHLTPRWVLQYWGTELCREKFHQDIWIASLENRLKNALTDIVISDARFVNELGVIKNIGGHCVRITRGSEPEWWDLAKSANSGCVDSEKKIQDLGVHASEYSWIGFNFEHTIYNTGTLTDLKIQVNDLVRGFHHSR
jgi:hypothetical protein